MSAEEGAGGREKQWTDDPSDEAILRELCAASGCNYERLLENGKDENVMKIEIFFFGFPRICGLHHFPNLTKLCVVNQPIRSLAGLESCDHLTELWVCETALEDMRNVECCVGLVQLYLYSNRISGIQGLDKLVYLEKLWLNSNRLSRLEGLGNLGNLRDLNLAGNTLTSIRGAVEHLRKLEIFDLSGNQISSFEDLSPLSDLPSLHSLSLSHPHHPPNPLSLLCNYSSLLLFSLPQLTTLDGQDVSSPDVKSLVQGLVSKKKMFYRMKVKHEQEVMDRKCHAHQQEVRQLQEVVSGRLRTLHTALGRLKLFRDDTEEEEEEEERKREKCRLIQERIEHLTSYLDHITATSSDHLSRLRNELDWQTRLWQIELGSGGNIKFLAPVEGHWHRACTELVKSRFSAANWQEFGFSGVEVRQVLRIENRKLRHRLTSAVQTILEQSGPGSIPPPDDLSDLMEYLFLVWNPELDLLQVCSDGFPERRGSPPVSLTDSIMFADLPRLRHSSGRGQRSRDESGRGNKSRDENQTHLLLCKVFKGQHMEISSSGIPSPSDHPSSHSVCRHANAHSSEWFVFHPALVIPSFLISLRYLTPGPSKSVLDHMTSRDPHTPTDDVILDHAPILPAQPKLALLDEASILRVSNCTDLSDVKDLCLHGNHLTRFRLSSCPSSLTHSLLPNLTTLTLSCNEIHTAEDFHNLPQLVELDLSFNRIATLEGMKNLPKLQKLDVSWNSLTCYFTDVSVLRRHAPALVSFHCSHNPWTSPDLFRRHTLTRLKNLRCLDNTPVTPDDTSAAVAYCTASQLSSSSLSPHIHTLTVPPPSLSLSFITYSLIKLPSPTFTDSIHNWGHKVTSLHLAGRSVRRLSCFDQLPNLLWLSLDNNTISNIEALSLCTKLQEASLDNNHISDLTPLCSLRHLQTLSADGNSLSSLPEPRHLRSLTSLHCLSLSHNQLSDLTPMEVLTSIEELYISSNDIHDRRQLFHLKPLRSLLILSLENNHLATPTPEVGGATGGATHRMFAVYHLHSLRALDGIPLEQSEVAQAKEKLGGRLTQDMIYELSPSLDLSDARTLDLPACGVRLVDLSPFDLLKNLASLNLEQNSLTSLSGLVHLNQLKVLCLNHNKIECLLPRETTAELGETTTVLRSLQVLHLAYNGISNMGGLQLSCLPSLRALFLQGNEISRVDGLTGLTRLTELVLDRNRIKAFHERSFSNLVSLRVLLVEENRLRSLSHLDPLVHLERLFLGGNKIQDYAELDKLHPLSRLLEISLLDNPIARRHQHRPITIFNLPSLLSLDGLRVTSQERQNAEAIFSITEEQDMVEMLLPGIPNRPAHLRVMNMPFVPTSSVNHAHNHSDTRRNRGNNERR